MPLILCRWSVVAGGTAWTALAAGAAVGLLRLGIIEVLFLLAPLVLLPLGLPLVAGEPTSRPLRLAALLQPWSAALAAVSFFLPPGAPAAALAAPWFLVTALVALAGLVRLPAAVRGGLADLLICVGMLFLPVGGFGLVASRAGFPLGGFPEPIILLTAIHFHYTGFAAPLLVALAGRRAARMGGSGPLFAFSAIGTIAATPLIATGFVFSPALKLAAIVWLTIALAAGAALQLRILPSLASRGARLLLACSALSILAGMALAAVFGLGEFTRKAWIGIPAMARTHGVLNGIGFALLGLLAWRREDP